MAYHSDLKDIIHVKVNAKQIKLPKKGGSASTLATAVERYVNEKIKRAKTELAPNIGLTLAIADKFAQQNAIRRLNAICEGDLLNSIMYESIGGSSTSVSYRVGTNITEKYPHYVQYGRPEISLTGKRAMKFKPKCRGNYIIAKHVEEAKPKPYKTQSEAEFKGQIEHYVRSEIDRVLS